MRRQFAITVIAALAAAPGGAQAETPARIAEVWRAPLSPDAGFEWALNFGLAVHADGTAMAAFAQQRAGEYEKRYLVTVAIGKDGAVLARKANGTEPLGLFPGTLVPDRDGFALAVSTAKGPAALRLARDGGVRARHALPARTGPHDVTGIAAGPRGELLVFGGYGEGPHPPAMTVFDARGRVVWRYAGRHAMPPGGVQLARFRRDGGSEALVIDREKHFWERRSPGGAVIARTPVEARHWQCRALLGEHGIAELLYNFAEAPTVPGPRNAWVLALTGADGRVRPGGVALDAPKRENAPCRLATGAAGRIALSLGPGAIRVFDAELAPRAEIALAPREAEVEALAVGGDGTVTAILRIGEREPRFEVVRYAATPR